MEHDFDEQLYIQTGATRARKIFEVQLVFLATVTLLNVLSVKMAGIYWPSGEVIKIFGVSPIYFSVGTILYAVTFPCTDIVSELVGYKTARRMVWRGLFCSFAVIVACKAAIAIPAADFWTGQAAYEQILGSVPRIMVAGMCSYFVAQQFDTIFFDKTIEIASSSSAPSALSSLTDSFWKRALVTTTVSQFLDSVIFATIAFWGTADIPFTSEAFFSRIAPLIFVTWAVKAILTVPLIGVISILEKWIGYSNEEGLPDEVYLKKQMEASSS